LTPCTFGDSNPLGRRRRAMSGPGHKRGLRLVLAGLTASETRVLSAGLGEKYSIEFIAEFNAISKLRSSTRLQLQSGAGATIWRTPHGIRPAQAGPLIAEISSASRVFCIASAPLDAAFCIRNGAWDAVCDPYSFDEAIVRLGRIAALEASGEVPHVVFGVQPRSCDGHWFAAYDSNLRRAELKILTYLARESPRYVPTLELQRCVLESEGDGSAVRFHIREIRRAMGRNLIETRRGLGYRLTGDLT
jgi:hypothetical protein